MSSHPASPEPKTNILLPHYSLAKAGRIDPVSEQHFDHYDIDARGLVKLWEPPKPYARYVMGVDPTGGIIGWNREYRNDDDLATDNGAIEVIRLGDGMTTPDVQVAEYAAPIDPEDLASVCALLGRLYCGASEYGEALAIIEIWPGPGLLTQRRLINEFGYTNLFRWEYLDSAVPKATNSYGWQSNVKTLSYLWSRFARHVGKDRLVVKSQWLQEEMADLQNVPGSTFPETTGEHSHDDRVRAIAMAVWAGHGWSLAEVPEPTAIETPQKRVNWQASDISDEDMYREWEEMFQNLLNS